MAKVTFDLTDQDPEESTQERKFELPERGVYPARIASAVSETPEGKNPRLHVVVEITKPAKNNYQQMHDYIVFTDASAWKLDQFLQAVGIATKSKRKGSFEDKSLVGKQLQINVGHETSEWNGEMRTRARVLTYLAKGKVSSNGAAATADADEEIDFVMHGAAADEGDEESAAYLREQAEALGIDPDEIATWAEVATLIEEQAGEEEAEEEEAEEEVEEEEVDELDALAEQADADDDDAQQAIFAYIDEHELEVDPNEFDTWAEVVEAIRAGGEEETEEIDYETMSVPALKKLAKERGIPATGSREELIERHEEFDGTDPFAE